MDGSVDKRPPLLQTYGLQLNESSAVEMCTFVRKVLEDSAAENAGLTAGEPPTPFTRAYTHTHTHTRTRASDLIAPSCCTYGQDASHTTELQTPPITNTKRCAMHCCLLIIH